MVVEYIRYRVPEDRTGDLESAYAEARGALDASPHCLAYELTRCVEEPVCYVLRIEWDSVAGHMEGFRRSPGFQAFLGHVRPFIGAIEEMRHYEPTSVRGRSVPLDRSLERR